MDEYEVEAYQYGATTAQADYAAGWRHDPAAGIAVDVARLQDWAYEQAERATANLTWPFARDARRLFAETLHAAYLETLTRLTRDQPVAPHILTPPPPVPSAPAPRAATAPDAAQAVTPGVPASLLPDEDMSAMEFAATGNPDAPTSVVTTDDTLGGDSSAQSERVEGGDAGS